MSDQDSAEWQRGDGIEWQRIGSVVKVRALPTPEAATISTDLPRTAEDAPKRRSLRYIIEHADELADYAENADPSTMTETTTPEMRQRYDAWKNEHDRR